MASVWISIFGFGRFLCCAILFKGLEQMWGILELIPLEITLFKIYFIEIQSIYNIVLIPTVYQSNSVIHLYIPVCIC